LNEELFKENDSTILSKIGNDYKPKNTDSKSPNCLVNMWKRCCRVLQYFFVPFNLEQLDESELGDDYIDVNYTPYDSRKWKNKNAVELFASIDKLNYYDTWAKKDSKEPNDILDWLNKEKEKDITNFVNIFLSMKRKVLKIRCKI